MKSKAKSVGDDTGRIKQVVQDALKEEKVATKGDLVDFKDAILYEIQNLRDDVAIVTGYKDEIEEHEDRIHRLEKKVGITTTS